MKRRQFLTALSGVCLAAAGVAWFWLRPRAREDPVQPDDHGWGSGGVPIAPDGRPVFPERFRQTLRAMSERLVPDELGSPGAAATDAFTYVEREAARPEMQGVRRRLMRGASQLDRLARQRAGKLYSKAALEDQDAIIAAMIQGE
ncbi:MAG: gluconate 2-dehydrogenase subunit 3 family protein, partial [Myxococcota bacterium]